MKLSDFAAGDRVKYAGEAKPCNFGRTATVKKLVKRRNVVVITWDGDGTAYDAYPESLVKIGAPRRDWMHAWEGAQS